MHHYTECGLDNVWLINGFETLETENGQAHSVHAMNDLHKAIALSLVTRDASLTGKELRFLRVELDLSQKGLGTMLGKSEQQVANWEKGVTPLPVLVDASVRQCYSETFHNKSRLSDLLKKLNALDKHIHELQIALEETSEGWKLSA
jgi:putative transcriptional regulator